jgi:enoyl-CoA hydratase/carnithine racemase
MSYPLCLPFNDPLLTLTNPKPSIWIIELHNGEDNRLTPTLVDQAFKPALDVVERHWREQWRAAKEAKDNKAGGGSLIIVGKRSQDKFFSNGLDFQNVLKNPNFFSATFNPLLARILTFPIPTIAAINGHCFAGGLMLAMCCDYRVMTDGTKRSAWLCMNEVHFGAVLPVSFAAVLRAKVGDDSLRRKIALEGHRFSPSEALQAGILDHIITGNTNAVVAKAEEIAERQGKNAKEGVWGLIKNDLYRDTLEAMRQDLRITNAFLDDAVAKSRL